MLQLLISVRTERGIVWSRWALAVRVSLAGCLLALSGGAISCGPPTGGASTNGARAVTLLTLDGPLRADQTESDTIQCVIGKERLARKVDSVAIAFERIERVEFRGEPMLRAYSCSQYVQSLAEFTTRNVGKDCYLLIGSRCFELGSIAAPFDTAIAIDSTAYGSMSGLEWIVSQLMLCGAHEASSVVGGR